MVVSRLAEVRNALRALVFALSDRAAFTPGGVMSADLGAALAAAADTLAKESARANSGLEAWAAVRRILKVEPDGLDWIDVDSLSPSEVVAQRSAADTDAAIPAWAIGNPVVRVVRVRVEEV